MSDLDDEEERQREFEQYCRETQLPRVYFAVFGIIVAIIAGLFWRGL